MSFFGMLDRDAWPEPVRSTRGARSERSEPGPLPRCAQVSQHCFAWQAQSLRWHRFRGTHSTFASSGTDVMAGTVSWQALYFHKIKHCLCGKELVDGSYEVWLAVVLTPSVFLPLLLLSIYRASPSTILAARVRPKPPPYAPVDSRLLATPSHCATRDNAQVNLFSSRVR